MVPRSLEPWCPSWTLFESTGLPKASRLDSRRFLTQSLVIAPSNRSIGPTPSRDKAATTVLFSPRLAGAVAYARWPRGAQAWVGV